MVVRWFLQYSHLKSTAFGLSSDQTLFAWLFFEPMGYKLGPEPSMFSLEVNTVHQRSVASPSQVPLSPGSPQDFPFPQGSFLKSSDQKMTHWNTLASHWRAEAGKKSCNHAWISSWNSSFLGWKEISQFWPLQAPIAIMVAAAPGLPRGWHAVKWKLGNKGFVQCLWTLGKGFSFLKWDLEGFFWSFLSVSPSAHFWVSACFKITGS